MTYAFIFGTRPDAIKIGPVVAELRALGADPALIATGQHTTLLKGTPAESDLAGSVSLGLPSVGRIWQWVATATPEVEIALRHCKATAVVVQGDTMSALAGARAAKKLELPLHHIEAGLRSHDPEEPYPEERIRTQIAQLADWHYAPTTTATENLLAEGVPNDRIVLSGNTVVSALARYAGVKPCRAPGSTILITMHRRESRATGAIAACFVAAERWALENPDADIAWPVHPGVASGLSANRFYGSANFRVMAPLAYREMLQILTRARGIATDSGGLQEESAVLGVPCAVLRGVSDRPESITAGMAKRFDPTPEGMTAALDTLWGQKLPRRPLTCYGGPNSARIIARWMVDEAHGMHKRPANPSRFLTPPAA